jgi:hypothetical protein
MISKVCIKTDLNLPGTFGLIIKKSFEILDRIKLHAGEKKLKKIISIPMFIKYIDDLILTISSEAPDTNTDQIKTKRSVKSILIIAASVLIASLPVFIFSKK